MTGECTSGSEWICVPCSEMVPNREGRVTVHGDTDPDHLTVWCPWCGDAMEQPASTEIDRSYGDPE